MISPVSCDCQCVLKACAKSRAATAAISSADMVMEKRLANEWSCGKKNWARKVKKLITVHCSKQCCQKDAIEQARQIAALHGLVLALKDRPAPLAHGATHQYNCATQYGFGRCRTSEESHEQGLENQVWISQSARRASHA